MYECRCTLQKWHKISYSQSLVIPRTDYDVPYEKIFPIMQEDLEEKKACGEGEMEREEWRYVIALWIMYV